MESTYCIHCGKKLKNKPGHYECYSCRCIERFGRKGGNTPKHQQDKAIKTLSKKPLLWRVIFFSIIILISISFIMAKNTNKVDYKVMSNQKCIVCGAPLKQNKAIKGHQKCFVCFEVSKGKKVLVKGNKKLDLLATQQKLINHYSKSAK